MGVWIETSILRVLWMVRTSHPAWVCGLKHYKLWTSLVIRVTPCVGVWIETSGVLQSVVGFLVTPCVGVWIETSGVLQSVVGFLSHPAWVCGLKQYD